MSIHRTFGFSQNKSFHSWNIFLELVWLIFCFHLSPDFSATFKSRFLNILKNSCLKYTQMPKVFQSNEKGYIPKNLTPNIQTKSLLKKYMYTWVVFFLFQREIVCQSGWRSHSWKIHHWEVIKNFASQKFKFRNFCFSTSWRLFDWWEKHF